MIYYDYDIIMYWIFNVYVSIYCVCVCLSLSLPLSLSQSTYSRTVYVYTCIPCLCKMSTMCEYLYIPIHMHYVVCMYIVCHLDNVTSFPT